MKLITVTFKPYKLDDVRAAFGSWYRGHDRHRC